MVTRALQACSPASPASRFITMAAQHTENDATIARGLAAAAAVREGGPAPLARALTARTEHAVAEAVRTHDLALKMYGAARVGSQN